MLLRTPRPRHVARLAFLSSLAVLALGSIPAEAKDRSFSFPLEVAGDQGREKVVPLGAADADGIEGLVITIGYDPAVLTATRVAGAALAAGLTVNADLSTPGAIRVTFGGGRIEGRDGVLADVTFGVIGAVGTSSPLDLVSANAGGDRVDLRDGVLRVVGPTASALRLVNAGGAEVATYDIGATIFVEVADPDRNRDSGRAETLVASIRSEQNGDTESVNLAETAASSGVFRGSIRTVHSGRSRANGLLDVRGNDTATASYSDPSDPSDASTASASVKNLPTSAAIAFVDVVGRTVTRVQVGTSVLVRVTDRDRNLDPDARDSVTVDFSVPGTRDAESVVLLETGFASGEFLTVGGLPTELWADAAAGDGILQVLGADRIQATYSDASNPGDSVSAGVDAALAPTPSATRFVSAAGEDRTAFTIETEGVGVLVTDGDKNLNPGVAETLVVSIGVSITGDTERVTLTETGPATGVFRGLLTSVRASAAVAGDGVLQTFAGGTATVTYADPGDPADRTTDSALFHLAATPATLRVTDAAGEPITIASPGDEVWVEVTDGDRDLDPETPDTIEAQVDVNETGDFEPLVLVETGASTGIFKSSTVHSALSAAAQPANECLEVKGTSCAIATYVDPDRSEDTASQGLDFVPAPTEAAARFFDAATGDTRAAVLVGSEPARIEVADADQNVDPGAVEIVSVTLTIEATGDVETLSLAETGPSSGIFRASIPTVRDSAGTPGDGVLAGPAGARVAANYVDSGDPSDVASAEAALALEPTSSSLEITDAAGHGIAGLVASQLIFPALRDADQDLDPGTPDSASVVVTVPSGDSEILALVETGARTGEFRPSAGLPTEAAAAAIPGNGVLEVVAGEAALVSYADPRDPSDTSSASIVVADPSRLSILRITDAVGRDVSRLVIGRDSIHATLSDPSRDLDPNAADSVPVRFQNPRTGDVEEVTLVETGLSTGNFVNPAGIGLGFGSAVSADGTVAAIGGDVVAAAYTDPSDPADVSTDSADVEASGSASTAVFTNAAGAEKTRYEIGSEPIFVTVTDADQNLDPDVVDSVAATLRVAGSNDREALVLVETGANTGVFRNAAGLPSAASSVGVPGNGTVEGRRGYFIEAEYVDPTDAADVARASVVFVAGKTPSTLRMIDSAGRDVTVRTIGTDRITVEVTDGDKNADRTVIDEVSVTVTTPRGEREVLRLLETDADTGLFRSGGVPTDFRVPPIPGNFVIGGADNDVVTARYVDAEDPSDVSSDTVTLKVRPTASTVRATNATGIDVDRFRIIADRLFVTVHDADENRDPSTAQTIRALVTDPVTADVEEVVLVETSANSGTFRNSGGLPLMNGTPTPGDGRLDGRHLDAVRLEYVDPDLESGDSSACGAELLLLSDSEIFFVSDAGFSTRHYVIGTDRVFVRVEDSNQNLSSSSRDIVEAVIDAPASGDSELVVLLEIGTNTGVFAGPAGGVRLSRFRSVVPDDGELIVEPGDIIFARYSDSMYAGDESEDRAEVGNRSALAGVPALDEWGLMLLMALFGAALVTRLRRQ